MQEEQTHPSIASADYHFRAGSYAMALDVLELIKDTPQTDVRLVDTCTRDIFTSLPFPEISIGQQRIRQRVNEIRRKYALNPISLADYVAGLKDEDIRKGIEYAVDNGAPKIALDLLILLQDSDNAFFRKSFLETPDIGLWVRTVTAKVEMKYGDRRADISPLINTVKKRYRLDAL